jgi:hypothetical protein
MRREELGMLGRTEWEGKGREGGREQDLARVHAAKACGRG